MSKDSQFLIFKVYYVIKNKIIYYTITKKIILLQNE